MSEDQTSLPLYEAFIQLFLLCCFNRMIPGLSRIGCISGNEFQLPTSRRHYQHTYSLPHDVLSTPKNERRIYSTLISEPINNWLIVYAKAIVLRSQTTYDAERIGYPHIYQDTVSQTKIVQYVLIFRSEECMWYWFSRIGRKAV